MKKKGEKGAPQARNGDGGGGGAAKGKCNGRGGWGNAAAE